MLSDELIQFFMQPQIQKELALTAITIANDREAAQDLLQDVACILYVKADEIGNVEAPLAFLRTCVRNVAKNWAKRERRRICLDPASMDSILGHHSDDKDTILFEIRDWIMTSLPEYEQERKEAFIQYYLDGYPLAVLAKRYGVSVNALSQQFFRMRSKLKKRYPIYF